jgi:DNA-binding CsgD family transcriptional regulator
MKYLIPFNENYENLSWQTKDNGFYKEFTFTTSKEVFDFMKKFSSLMITINANIPSFIVEQNIIKIFVTEENLTSQIENLVDKDNIKLSKSEIKVLELVKKGYTYNEIAEILNVSFHAINHHLRNIYVKYGVNSKMQLVAKLGI